MCKIQKPNGSWYDAYDKEPYVFDTAQILKGLVSVHDILPEVEEHIISGCDWIIRNINEEGRLLTPSKNAWGDDESFCSELIHLYCLTPLVDAAKIYSREEYRKAAIRVLNYYKKNYREKILNFSLLSHFYAYVMEGLLDLGEKELVSQAMGAIEKYQNRKGGIPGLADVKWVCSTGMFQLALVWYKLGELEKGNKIFNYACTFQNETGGWYGSYPVTWMEKFAKGRKKAYYFPCEEISWANKYFLDALAYKMKLEFEAQADHFIDEISKGDGRYKAVKTELLKIKEGYPKDKKLKICDVGCGKGRYLKNLKEEMPNEIYYAVDLSERVMQSLDSSIEKRQGRLTKIPYEDETFDYVYVCEALEHAVNMEGALKELWRIVKPKGSLLILDKPVECLGRLEIDEWEQWIDTNQVRVVVDNGSGELEIVENVEYEAGRNDGLFRAWICRKCG